MNDDDDYVGYDETGPVEVWREALERLRASVEIVSIVLVADSQTLVD